MAAGVLILVGFAIMGWSALGLINPVRFAEGSRGRAFGVGVIGFALFHGGRARCSNLNQNSRQRRDQRQLWET